MRLAERQVEVYLNVTIGSAFLDYKETDGMRCAFRGEMILPEDDTEACQILWMLLNRLPTPDHTPAKEYQDRSLSIGDLITLDGQLSYTPRTVGWESVGLRTGDQIVGPEGDEKLAKATEGLDALPMIEEGVKRMTEGLNKLKGGDDAERS